MAMSFIMKTQGMASEITHLLFIAWIKKISCSRVILQITDGGDSNQPVILEPGEVVTFAAFASETGTDVQVSPDSNAPGIIQITRKPQGKVEKGYVWDSGFALNNDACAFIIQMGGLAGYQTKTAENFNPQGMVSSIGWGSSNKYVEPKCFTLWQGQPDLDSSVIVSRFTEPKTVIPDAGEKVKFTTNNYLALNLEETAKGDYEKKLFGLGWEVSLILPGDLNNERIPLVEFNTRALVHSTQHGQGNWLGNANIRRPSHYEAPPQLNVSPSASPTSYSIDGTNFSFNTHVTGYVPRFPKSTPDIYVPPTTRPEGPISDINNFTNPDTRATALGFTKRTVSYDFDDSDNPEFVYNPVVRILLGQERIGFFSKDTSTNTSPYRSEFTDSQYAVLFEVSEGKKLSILQYRHANLNNYLHGPSYALGNSYASTQVARHRSWGRVQNIVKRPTSEGGLTSVSQNLEDEKDAIDFYKKIFGPEIANKKGLGNFINWDIDPDGGFAPWRNSGADQLNHQNTTIDHSYYLNNALMDGFSYRCGIQ